MKGPQNDPFARSFTPIDIPTDLDGLLGFEESCGCGTTHSVSLRGASVRPGALEEVATYAREIGAGLSITVVVDRVTEVIAGHAVTRLLRAAGHRVTLVTVPDGAGGRPHADEPNLTLVEKALGNADAAVAVGAGTLNDLTKLASYRRGIPYLVVATAPSMNGYTSAIAAIMIRGVKRTVSCHQPHAVIADIDIIKEAPLCLTRAGLGDLISKPTASADFRLGNLLRGTYFCSVPEQVVVAAEKRASAMAAGLEDRDTEAVEALTNALLLSGISMKLAGSSGPASGGEHLISHFWDMTAASEGRVEGWHGAQVGIATMVTATLYEHLQRLDPGAIDVDAVIAARPDPDGMSGGIRARHGAFADEVLAEWTAKQLSETDHRATLETVRSNWASLWNDLNRVLVPSHHIRDVLEAAGAPVRVTELGLTAEHLRRAFTAAAEIRNRYTVLDFAKELGVFDEIAEDVLEASGSLGATG